MFKVSFKTSVEDYAIISKIAKRAIAMNDNVWGDKQDCEMDITACHCNGNPLRLKDLLEADDFNFAHDVFGIARHLNRKTGELEDMFSPRYSA